MSAPQKVVVLRGDRFDVAEWAAGEPGWFGAPPPRLQTESSSGPTLFAIVAAALVLVGTALLVRSQRPATLMKPLVATIADVQAVHAHVTTPHGDVRRIERVAVGETVATDGDGRGRLRLDDGTVIVLDRSTAVALTAKGLDLTKGRIFVLGAPGARTEVGLDHVTAIVAGSNTGIERTKTGAKVYVATEEVTIRTGGAEQAVRAGDTGSIEAGKLVVAPERGFDDWTGGMAAPWGATGAPRRAVGDLWGRPPNDAVGAAGSPLTVRSHDVRATITRELAETEVTTTFFNAGSEIVRGDYRLAIPPGAVVSRFATTRNQSVSEGRIALAARGQTSSAAGVEVLEWAGEGWVRGTVPSIPPGTTVGVVVAYVEWLAPRPAESGSNVLVQYRYPLASDAAPPLIGEFSAFVDAGPSSPVSIASGLGARVTGQAVEVRRPDFRPTADLVVDVELPAVEAPARLYSAPPLLPDDAGATVLVRTEVPRAAKGAGVTLALVLDVSASLEPALLDAERALVEAVIDGLGADDRVAVLAADQLVRPVGPAGIGKVDDARRKAIREGLTGLSPGGATDLGRALEAGADALPADAPAGMVIYVGDGWPTMGDATVAAMLARLARRPNGTPRLGAVAVGPIVNRFALASLVRGSGPLLEIADSTDAAKTAVALLAEALQPTVADVELRFGPEVERVYPRTARSVVAGSTITAVGRVRGEPPTTVTLRWRDAQGTHEEVRPLAPQKSDSGEVTRAWAAARVDEIALGNRGREAATDVALQAGLLTPWTGWTTASASVYVPTPLTTRILDLAIGPEAGFTAAFATPQGGLGTLANVVHETEEVVSDKAADAKRADEALKRAVARAAARILADATEAVLKCRDSRAALRPDLAGKLRVALELDGEGHADGIKVRGEGTDDDALDRCVETIVAGLIFPASGIKLTVQIDERIALPALRGSLRGHTCSPTSSLPMPLRRGVWRERLDRRGPVREADVYLDARADCELPTWTDRRALLELMLDGATWQQHVTTAHELGLAGEADAANLLEREIVRRARTPEVLREIQRALAGDESYPRLAFRKQYEAAGADGGRRLEVVRRFLAIAPHDPGLKRRLLRILEAEGMKQELADEVRRTQNDPFADAALLADGASALRRLGDEAGAKRAFGELAERAPEDGWARAFLGDRLRNEGWFEDATRAYRVLEELAPDDPGAILRLAIAHAGAGRLDLAQRMLGRVAETGGRMANARLGELSARYAHALVAEARAKEGISEADAERLARVAAELPYPEGATVFLVRAPAGAEALHVTMPVARGAKKTPGLRSMEIAAPGLGLYSARIEASETSPVTLRLRRRSELAPAPSTHVRIDALVPGDGGPKLVTTEIDLPISGKDVDLVWSDGGWSKG